VREYNGSTLVGSNSAQLALTVAWQQISVAYAVAAPGSTLDLNAYVAGAAPGTCFDADDATLTFRQADPTDAPPSASLAVAPASGAAPLTVSADASASSDTDTTPIASYAFDFGDGSSTVGPQASATASHTYTSGGTYTVAVTVADSAGNQSKATAQVVVSPPSNLIGNGGFETDTSGWNTSGGGSAITLTRVPGGHSGDWAAELSNGGSTNSSCLLNDSPNWVRTTTAGTYTASLWARAGTAGTTLTLRVREYSGSTLVGTKTAQLALTGTWQKISVAYTVAAAGSTLDLNAYIAGAAPGTCFDADDASLVGP
jgi:PKD repeat protein